MRGYNDGYDDCSGGSNNTGESGNDPCNYHGINVCDSSGQCDNERFDCYSDDCVNGGGGTTGQCQDDDEPYNNNDNDNDSTKLTMIATTTAMTVNQTMTFAIIVTDAKVKA